MWLLLLAGIGLSNAEEPAQILDADYVTVQKGQPSPFEGFLFTSDAVSQIIVKHNEEIGLLRADHNLAIANLESKKRLEYDLLNLKYNSEIKMYQEMITVRDEQIRASARKDVLQRWGVYGGFIIGAASSIAIFYSVNHD